MFNVYDEVSREAFRDREVIDFDRPSPDEYRDDRTSAEIAAMAAANPAPVSAADFAPKGDTVDHAAARAADDIPF